MAEKKDHGRKRRSSNSKVMKSAGGAIERHGASETMAAGTQLVSSEWVRARAKQHRLA